MIVVDNASTDRSAEVAAEHGAIVVREERPGYGSAYLAGLAVARGEFIVMGDADETYPMRDLAPFVERLAAGDDLVMGSRFEGTIHGEAMPWLNRHVGNPILTGLLNVLFGVKVSDAHCGMRAVRRDALEPLDLHSTGMEFASEMVFKAFRRKLRVSEIPIDYYPRVGESKLNRFGDAWRHVRFMLLYSPSWLYFVPGVILLVLGVVGAIALAAGPVTILGRTWQIHTLFLCIVRDPARRRRSSSSGSSPARSRRRTSARPTRWSSAPAVACGSSTDSPSVGSSLLAGVATLLVIFVSWALDGFGALSHEYATAVGVHARRARDPGDPRLVLPRPADDAHHGAVDARRSWSASRSRERLRAAQRAAAGGPRSAAGDGARRRPGTCARRRVLVRLPRPAARRSAGATIVGVELDPVRRPGGPRGLRGSPRR